MYGYSGWREFTDTISGADFNGWGRLQGIEASELKKALGAGASINAPAIAAGEGFPLRLESLERVMKNVTYRNEHFVFYRDVPKGAAFNTVEEFNRIRSYGQDDLPAFIGEFDLPEETDSTFERAYSIVKFIGTTRRVSLVMALVSSALGNTIAAEQISGAMYLLRQIELGLLFGDSGLDPYQWDGIEAQMVAQANAANIIDLRGAALTEDILFDASGTARDAPSFGLPGHLYYNLKNHFDFIKGFFPKARYDAFTHVQNGMVGRDIAGVVTPMGAKVMFRPSSFITPGRGLSQTPPSVAVGNAAKRPATPTIGVVTVGAAAGSLFTEVTDIGVYRYKVAAFNRFGCSAATAEFTATITAVGQGVSIPVTPAAGFPLPSYYVVYRTDVGGVANAELLIMKVANSGGVGATTIVDRNAFLPGRNSAFLLQMDQSNLKFKQLMPMIKMALGVQDTSYRWMQLLFGVLQLYTPNHNILFRNIGRMPDSVGAL